jgi:SAM-dependent methyltransferase
MSSSELTLSIAKTTAGHSAWQLENVCCNLCGSNRPMLLFSNDSHGYGLNTVCCDHCGLVYLDPRPTAREYERLYQGLYEKLYPSAWMPGALGDAIAETRLRWYGDFLSPEIKLLEIGPGSGAFLDAVQKKAPGAAVFGVEPSPDAVKACRERGLKVDRGYIEDFSGPAQVDCIAAFHVLEHALDPTALLVELWKRLSPGGLLFAEAPNILGRWRGLGMIHVAHPYQYSPNTFQALLEKTGFEVLQMAALEEKRFESSFRCIARKIKGPSSPSLPPAGLRDATTDLGMLFQERLSGWQAELIRFKLKRLVFRMLGPVLTRTLRKGLG